MGITEVLVIVEGTRFDGFSQIHGCQGAISDITLDSAPITTTTPRTQQTALSTTVGLPRCLYGLSEPRSYYERSFEMALELVEYKKPILLIVFKGGSVTIMKEIS